MELSSLKDIVSEFSIFRDFGPEQIEYILTSSELRNVDPGEVLITPGSPNDTFFLLVKGELRIILENDGTELSIPILPGECLGEMSILMEIPTSALAIGHQPSLVLYVPENIFWDEIIMRRKGTRNLMGMMAERLKRTNHTLLKEVEEQIKYKHIQKELETAGKIQSSILPDGSNLLPDCEEIDAYAVMDQARVVGGDFFDAMQLDDEHIYLAIGDVSGKGTPAALFMMRTFTSLRMLISSKPKFEDVVPSVNEMLAKTNEDMMFVSLFAGVLNVRTGVFRYMNCGHNPPFLSRAGGGYKPFLEGKSPIVGILEQARFSVSELSLQAGDSMLLYTDGITEAMNPKGVMFDMQRAQQLLNSRPYLSTKDLAITLESTVEAFVGTAPQHDDYTVLAFKYLGWEGAHGTRASTL